MSGAWDKETLCQQLEAMSKQRQALIDALAALLDAIDAQEHNHSVDVSLACAEARKVLE